MKVGIVGAGITGLALTHYLAEEGIESVTFEATDEAGGVIRSREVEGKILEYGPQRMRLSPGIDELATVAGVDDKVIETDEEKLYVYAGGRLGEAPLSVKQFFRTDLLSWRGKARLLAEPLTRSGSPEETVADLFVRKFGREAYERFIGPLYGGLYGSDPAEMPAAFALEGLLEREAETGNMLRAFRQRVGQGHTAPPITFERGNQQLTTALADTYADRIQLDTPVEAVRAVADDAKADSPDRYEIETVSGSEIVDRVVITTPGAPTADILEPLAADDHVSGLDGLQTLTYNPLAFVFMEAHHDRPGKGYQVGYDMDLHTLGVSWNATMFGRDGVHTAFLGGMHEPEMMDRSDEELGEIATREFEAVMGSSASVIEVHRLDPGFPAWDQSWWQLENLRVPDGISLATNYTARMGIPSRVREARELASSFASATDDTAAKRDAAEEPVTQSGTG